MDYQIQIEHMVDDVAVVLKGIKVDYFKRVLLDNVSNVVVLKQNNVQIIKLLKKIVDISNDMFIIIVYVVVSEVSVARVSNEEIY